MLLVLDNYDSFTYNLVQLFGELGVEPVVYRNDQITVEGALALKPSAIVLSPGPRTPSEAGILVPLVLAAAGRVPMLGVCLGHQAIAVAFGGAGAVVRAERLMHGKTCPVVHDEDELFDGIPSPFTGMRYHSLVVDAASLPADLVPTAWAGDQPRSRTEIMAMKHRRHPVYGVQFHPESIGTQYGKTLLENFLRVARAWPTGVSV
jgi:anthranilate synthase/aminodeoxychorismate synthase-like glutamine amidotransferase